MNKLLEKFLWWIAYKLPRKLVYLCAIRVWSYATTGKYGNTEATAITFVDGIKRWDEQWTGKADV